METKKTPPTSTPSIVSGAAESSFRVYYGATGAAVPFKWESQPGTPKHPLFSDSPLPPLTPPPSYFSGNSPSPSPSPSPKKKKKSKISADSKFGVLLPRLVKRNSSSPNSYSSSSSSSSSIYYSPSPSLSDSRDLTRGRSALIRFGFPDSVNRCCGYPVSNVKNAFFSVVACGRSRHSVDYIV